MNTVAHLEDLRWFLTQRQPVTTKQIAEAADLSPRTARRRVQEWRAGGFARPAGSRGPEFLWAPCFALVAS